MQITTPKFLYNISLYFLRYHENISHPFRWWATKIKYFRYLWFTFPFSFGLNFLLYSWYFTQRAHWINYVVALTKRALLAKQKTARRKPLNNKVWTCIQVKMILWSNTVAPQHKPNEHALSVELGRSGKSTFQHRLRFIMRFISLQ